MRHIVYVVSEQYKDNFIGVYRSLATAKEVARSLLRGEVFERCHEVNRRWSLQGTQLTSNFPTSFVIEATYVVD